jgi:hypothetical protein
MTPAQEKTKTLVIVLFIIGVAGIAGSFFVANQYLDWGLSIAGFLCIVLAGRMAMQLKKETGAA